VLTTHYLEEAEALADRVVVLAQGRVVAEGSVQSIRAHVSQRRVRCMTTLALDALAAWPQVRSASRVDGRTELVVENAEPVVRRLLAEDAALHELEVQRAGLSDAFIALTQEAA
jgi:ABC-2 type transport system ATP-binding protein